MPTRDPLQIEGVASRARRRRLIDQAIREGRYLDFVSALLRRDVLVERAMQGSSQDAQVEWARHVDAPILRAVASILGTQPDRVQLLPVVGDAQIPPPPAGIPAPLGPALDHILANDPVWRRIQADMAELATQEVAFASKAMVRHLPNQALLGPLAEIQVRSGPDEPAGPLITGQASQTAVAIEQRVLSSPMLGAQVEKTWDEALGGLKRKVEQQVGQALAAGQTNDQIVRMLRGTRQAQYADGTLGSWRANNIRAFVRTVGTHVVTQSREGTYAALGAPYVRLIATLDLRTSLQCIEIDGTIWPIGEGPRPPLHPNCRTATAPAWDRDEEAGLGGPRASMHGRVPGTTIAKEWFFGLTRKEQDTWIGATRAEAVRSGQIKFSQLLGPGLEPLRIRDLREHGLIAE